MSPPKDRELPPLQNSIAILPDYIAIRSTTLVLTETTSGYDFDITDRATGDVLFTVKGNTDSQTVNKEVLDTKGRPLFALRKKNARYPKDHRLEAPDGSPFMSVEWSWSTTANFTSRFPNATSDTPAELSMNASYFRRNGDFKLPNGDIAAHVFRDAWTSKDMWKGKRTYYLTVAPGMDMAVAVAACLYVHERVNEGSTGGIKGEMGHGGNEAVWIGTAAACGGAA